ncbi:hypothetical protein PFISCL1PPCAC_3374, partial [Pristionchus fissidentatus]
VTSTMKFVLILVLLFSSAAAVYYSCKIENDTVYETGFPPRKLTAEEQQKIVEYSKGWAKYGEQLTRSIFGQGPKPVAPVFPCVCRKCN